MKGPSAPTALVTGGGSGLGRAMAVGLLEHGFNVATVSLPSGEMEEFARSASQMHPSSFLGIPADIRDAGVCEQAAASCMDRFGAIDVLVNNAAITPTALWPNHDYHRQPKGFWEVDVRMIQTMMDVNFNGAAFMTSAVVRRMLPRKTGRIINVTTAMTTMQSKGFFPYGPSKAALEAASLIWQRDLEEHGITVNILNPGGAADTAGVPEQTREASRQGLRQKLVAPEDMVPPLRWLVSEEAAGFNGMRLDAKTWDPSLEPKVAASRSATPIGFQLRSI